MSKIKFPIFLVLFIFLLDLIVGLFLQKMYFSDNSKINDPFIYSFTKSNDDLVIFGSSRAKHHYNAKMISDSLNIKAFNFGQGGQIISFHKIQLENLLTFHKPKYVILDLMLEDFIITQGGDEKLNVLLPFCKDYPVVNNNFNELKSIKKIKFYSEIYPFNSKVYSIFRNNYLPCHNHLNGYIPIQAKTWKGEMGNFNIEKSNINYDLNKIKALKEFIELCNINNIKLFVFISPYYMTCKQNCSFKDITNPIEKKLNFESVDFSNIYLSKRSYFVDPKHLNKDGSNEFTKIVIDYLQSELVK